MDRNELEKGLEHGRVSTWAEKWSMYEEKGIRPGFHKGK